MTALGPLECMCWRRFAEWQGDCKKSQIAPLNAVIIIIINIIIIIVTGSVLRLVSLESVYCD